MEMNVIFSHCSLIFATIAMIPPIACKSVEGFFIGEQLFHEGLYEDAVSCYRDALVEVRDEEAEHLRLRLSQALLLAQRPEEALSLLESVFRADNDLQKHDETMEENASFLKGVCCRLLGDNLRAIKYLSVFTLEKRTALGLFQTQALFELGLCYFHQEEYTSAEDYFRLLANGNEGYSSLASLYLAKIALHRGNCDDALFQLENARLDKRLTYASAFLTGEAYLLLGEFREAGSWYKKAIPEAHAQQVEWYSEALAKSGLCCLKLAERAPLEKKPEYFKEAGFLFQTLSDLKEDENSIILQAQCYLTEAEAFGSNELYEKAAQILSNKNKFTSERGRVRALLLHAQASKSYEERDRLYHELTKEKDDAEFWLLRGAHALKEARQHGETAEVPLSTAISSLELACSRAYAEGKPIKDSLYQLAEAYLIQGSAEALQLGIARLQTYNRKEGLGDDKGEGFYLEALLKMRLSESSIQRNQLLGAARETANNGLKLCTERSSTIDLHLLSGAASYYLEDWDNAEESFLAAIGSKRGDEALYWLAATLDLQGKPAEEVRRRRNELHRQYPDSPYAGEAYFRCYTIFDYLYGGREPYMHLSEMPSLFPKHPYLIYGQYLMGLCCKQERKDERGATLQKKKLTAAIDCFQRAEELFEHHQKNKSLPSNGTVELTTLYFRATLERAKANLAIAEESQGVKKEVYHDYAESVLARLADQLSYARLPSNAAAEIEEEALYWLVVAHINRGHCEQAESLVDRVIENYRSAKVTRGYYLSRAWFLKGSIKHMSGDQDEALYAYSRAEETAKGAVLTADELLDLWLRQSDCHRSKGNLADAMRRLSDVINKDAISALRLKAMYLRAELYEGEGRHELARRQLIALAQKGGEWAAAAQKKLLSQYGYQYEQPR